MSTNVWYDGHCKHTDEVMKNEEGAASIFRMFSLLKNNEYPQEYVDVAFQKFYANGPVDYYDAYGFHQLHAEICSGNLAIFKIPTIECPCRDKDISGNNNILKQLPEPFYGDFYGGTQDEDGHISWDKPINAYIYTGNKINDEREVCFCIVPPMSVSLEVGYTDIGKTLMYTCFFVWNGCGQIGLARWPYSQNYITVITGEFVRGTDYNFNKYVNSVYGGSFFTYGNVLQEWDTNHKNNNNCKGKIK